MTEYCTVDLSRNAQAIIDEEDYGLVCQYKWCLHSKGYAIHRMSYEIVYLHRWIMNAEKGTQIDHINQNKLDCRKENLRFATEQQNRHNVIKYAHNTSGYKGVYFDKARDLWCAEIHLNYKKHFLGRYTTAIEAALAYDKASIKLHGEFANTNFKAEL